MNKFGADGVRVGMLFTSPAGNDLPFDESLCEQGRNFSNKIWNALRLVKGWEIDPVLEQSKVNAVSIEWFDARLNEAIKKLDEQYSKYRISEALMTIYRLIWDEFCSWYLEMIKPPYQKPIDSLTYNRTIDLFEKLMQVLHPFMPFLTEEIWQRLSERNVGDSIMNTLMPEKGRINHKLLDLFEYVREVIIAVRNVRKEKNIPLKEPIELFIRKNAVENPNIDTKFDCVVSKLCNISGISYTDEKKENVISFIVRSTEFYIPLTENIDLEGEIKKLEEELKYAKGFLNSVMKKLSNERFVNNAPEAVVEKERNKQADANAKIKVLEAQLASFKK